MFVYAFHQGTSASLRSWNIARAWAADGAEVEVFCLEGPGPADGRVPEGISVHSVGVGRSVLDRIETTWNLYAGGKVCRWLLLAVLRGRRFGRRARDLMASFEQVSRRTRIDFIVAVWPTFEPLWAARSVARKKGIRWAVEFQDPWRNFYYPETIREHVLPVMRSAVEGCSFLVNVCPAWCRDDQRDFGRKSVCISTGFWPSKRPPTERQRVGALIITYTGSLWNFDLQPLIEGMMQARQRGFPSELHYYGEDCGCLCETFEKQGCREMLVAHPRVAPEDAYAAQGESEALLLFTMPSKPSTFGYKFAEVVSHGLPVMLLGAPDREVEATAADCARVLACATSAEVARAIRQLHGDRPIRACPNPRVKDFTWERVAGRYRDAIVDSCLPPADG
jgi:glycosyltransferase involved in cell wall biosynthesis